LVVHGGAGGTADAQTDAARHAGCVRACDAGWRVLQAGGTAAEAVVVAVAALEDDPLFNAGVGSSLTVSGRVEMDASIMDGATLAAGAVAVVSRARHPIRVAHALMEDGRHVMMAGAGADAFAVERGLETADLEAFLTERQRGLWESRRLGAPGTVGAVALDRGGHVAAATSTGGMMFKRDGRIGDSAVIGAGTYADDTAGAASCTGSGETIMRFGLAKMATELLRDGRDPQCVAAHVVKALTQRLGGDAGIILVDRFGRVGAAHNTVHMAAARAVHGTPACAI
jgi:beta-aspartyl-peptidase (threonine type)